MTTTSQQKSGTQALIYFRDLQYTRDYVTDTMEHEI